jgi:diaminopimelate epimerase
MSDLLSFAKYEAAGNDFIVIEDLAREVTIAMDRASTLCDRRYGVGADGVIRLTRGRHSTFAMELVNADGSRAEISGNGIRCLAAYLYDRSQIDTPAVDVETSAGVRRVSLEIDEGWAVGGTVSMGAARFRRSEIPMLGSAEETFLAQPFDLEGGMLASASAVSMGNPHLVLFLEDDLDGMDLERIGPPLEGHELFPERTNVEFARSSDDGPIDVRVWERGVGETLACGTGACAVAAAAFVTKTATAPITIRSRGGSLVIGQLDDGSITLTGPVSHVFDGSVELGRLREGPR